jgi:predicted NUDIX family phosphoesterase
MKGHLFFNTWCATSMLAELLANVETETDIVIVDRGIFDALVWLGLQKKRGELTEEEALTFRNFLLLERWRSLIDLAVVMTVSAQGALERETSQRLTRKQGTIMNSAVLQAITESVDDAIRENEEVFCAIVKLDTSGKDFKKSGVELAHRVLDSLEAFLNPEILVVPRAKLEGLALDGTCKIGADAVEAALACISTNAHFMRRAEAEQSNDFVQVIPCGLLTHEKQIFLFQRKEKDPKSQLFGTTTLWQGCHTPRKDGVDMPALLKGALMDRISRSLFLSRKFPAEPIGYCWQKDDERSSRHFGLAYKIQIDNDATATDLRRKEFRKQRGYGLSGQFHTWSSLRARRDELNLESWSSAIVETAPETLL